MTICRSWQEYEDEKKKDPRIFNFNIIADQDPLMRTINEVHLCVPPKPKEYNFLKTPEEMTGETFDSDGMKIEIKDPRTNVTKILKLANELVKDYGYKSELTKNQQMNILQSLIINSDYNPKITNKNETHFKKQATGHHHTLKMEVKEKWNMEAKRFNECAEIYFYRHISELNNLLSSDKKSFLVRRWKLLECEFSEQKYQVITMLLRQKAWKQSATMSVEFSKDFSQHFNKQSYIIPIGFFPQIQRDSMAGLKFYNKNDDHQNEDISENIDIKISLEVLTALFLNDSEFSVTFQNSNMGTSFMSKDVVPSKTVDSVVALEEIVRMLLISNIEWLNINNYNLSQLKAIENEIDLNENLHVQTIDGFMEKLYARFKRQQGHNITKASFKMNKNDLNLNLLLLSEAAFYLSNDEMPVNISVKLEFQTKFGAEKMTKMELLKEWIQQTFSRNSTTLRYRIDARTLEILSTTHVTMAEIVKELHESYNYDPNESLEVLFNTLNTIKKLPHGDYMIQAKSDNKLYIHKTSNQGKQIISADDININPTFTHKWIPCDEAFPTFIHFHLKIAPCCFPVSIGKKNQSNPRKKSPKKKILKVASTSSVIIKKKKKFKKKKKKVD